MDAITQAGQGDAIQQAAAIFALKKSMLVEQQAALSLLDALPSAVVSINPPNLGQNVDIRA